MDEILLTHDQRGDAIDEALKRCVADKELSPAHGIAAEACRAQLRQVVEWMTKHWIEARKLDGAVQLTIEESDWQALRAAGEGK